MSTPAWLRAPVALLVLGLAACSADLAPGALPAYRLEHAGLHADLSDQGATVAPAGGAPWVFETAPRRFGCDGELAEVGAARPAEAGNRVEYRRPGIVEWYAETEAGIEQGFTLPSPPCGGRGRGVVVELGRGLRGAVSAGGRGARLRDASGRDVLRYTGLAAADAAGGALPARMEARNEGLAIRIDDTGAVYPIEIDPLIWAPSAMLSLGPDTPDASMGSELFGISVAVSGDTIVVGAPPKGNVLGEADVFVRSGAGWTRQQALGAEDVLPADSFGTVVAVNGDTAMVGALHRGSNGAAYVFDRTGMTWAPTQEILGPGPATEFGASLALDGDTAVVGAIGAAYVYVRSGTTWSLQQALDDPTPGDQFGAAVALDGDTLVVGAPSLNVAPGIVYFFARSGTTWSQQAALGVSASVTDAFGIAVAVKGDTAVVGAPSFSGPLGTTGAAFAYARTGTDWSMTQEIGGDVSEALGAGVAFDGTTLVAMTAAPPTLADGPHVYSFDAVFGTFSQQTVLPQSDEGVELVHRLAVDIDGKTLVTGRPDVGEALVLELVSTNGDACGSGTDCASGFCVDGVCCATASCPGAGPCNAAEHCQPGTGMCSNTPIHEGMACDAHDACTHDTLCQHGACVGPAETCAPANECREFGSCDPMTGACSSPAKPDGTACAGGVCKGGECNEPSAPPAPATHGCGCGVGDERGGGAACVGLGLTFFLTRRRARHTRRMRALLLTCVAAIALPACGARSALLASGGTSGAAGTGGAPAMGATTGTGTGTGAAPGTGGVVGTGGATGTGAACTGVTFAPPVSYPTGADSYSIALADLNGDGAPDLAVANHFDNTVSVLFNHGDGTFAPKVDYSTGSSPPPEGSQPTGVVATDLNGDGKPDLAVALNGTSSVGVLMNQGDGTFAPIVSYPALYTVWAIAAADLNGDGKPDLAVTEAGDNVDKLVVLLNQGDGTLGVAGTYGVGYDALAVAVADLNGDGTPDLAVSSRLGASIGTLLGQGDGTFAEMVTHSTGGDPASVLALDLNGDGAPDLVTTNADPAADPGNVSVLINQGGGTFPPTAAEYPTVPASWSVAAADMNADGIPDLVVVSRQEPTLSILLGNGDGTFASQIQIPTGASGGAPSHAVAVADLNGDGLPDIAIANESTIDGAQTVSVLLATCQK